MTVVFKYLKYCHVEGKSELFRAFQMDRIINYKEQISDGHEKELPGAELFNRPLWEVMQPLLLVHLNRS